MIVTLLRDNFGKLNAFYFDFFFLKGLIFWDIHKKKERKKNRLYPKKKRRTDNFGRMEYSLEDVDHPRNHIHHRMMIFKMLR